MMEYFSVGSPVGFLVDESKYYFYAGGNLHNMDGYLYRIWTCFFGGNYVEKVIENPELLVDMNHGTIEKIAKELIRIGLIVPLEEIGEFIPLRTGIGMGYHTGSGRYHIYTDQILEFSVYAYLIWSYSDGRRKMKEIYDGIQRMGVNFHQEEYDRSVLSLLRANAVFLSLED